VCQAWIPAGEQSGLLTHIAIMESVSLCERIMRQRFEKLSRELKEKEASK
jgi:hypothetical protein